MMKKTTITWVLLATACCLTATVQASHITLQTTAGTSYRDGTVKMSAKVTNQGDESAHSLWIEAGVDNFSARSETNAELEVDESFRTKLDLGPLKGLPGTYTAIIRTHYSDADGHPFSAVSFIPTVTGEPEMGDDPIGAKLSSGRLARRCTAKLSLSSAASMPVTATVSLLLPSEIDCRSPKQTVDLSPSDSKQLSFRLKNKQAIDGSSYPVFAVINYDLDGKHYSTVAYAVVSIEPDKLSERLRKFRWIPIAILLLAFLFCQVQTIPLHAKVAKITKRHLPLIVLTILFIFTLWHIPPKYLVLNTTTIGGDTPAHNYMASHLKEALTQGRLCSWADGWWSGFPLFQFYFVLPYLLIALLDFILPFNIAFKLVTVLGILSLPSAAYWSGRLMRLPKPGPILIAVAMIPFLFVRAHTMWGVSIYSTLAGMISNSISFSIMLLFIGSAYRDADDGAFRFRTVFLLILLIASHFFTTVIAGLCVAMIPFFVPRTRLRKAFLILAGEALTAFLVMAWWLIPLIAKQDYTVQFGTNWDVPLLTATGNFPFFDLMQLPLLALLAIPLVVAAIIFAVLEKHRSVAILAFMLIISVILFAVGYDAISHVFVNIRLWPFIYYAILALAATGTAYILRRLKAPEFGTVIILITLLAYGIGTPNHVRSWARHNYRGLELRTKYSVFEDLILPLDGTPGRLANDLHKANEQLGSSRIFELVPHLIDKPVLEGGILTSAAGSLFSYYVQGESSRATAGFPDIVEPTTFNITNATTHLELFNVKHFIARDSRTKHAMSESEQWKHLATSHEWNLYELTSHDGNYVQIPKYYPQSVVTEDWKYAGLDWIYAAESADQLFAILRPGELAHQSSGDILTDSQLRAYLANRHEGNITIPRKLTHRENYTVSSEIVSDNIIHFTTDAIGLPHLIKCSYYPNWKVRGAKKVFMVTPCFMLVYPEQEEVELYYGYTLSDNIGRTLSIIGLLAMAATAYAMRRNKA
jgi:hypothetical protein